MSRPTSTNSDKALGKSDQSAPPENLGGVFRLDALSPGGPAAGEGGLSVPKPRLSTQTLMLGVLLLAGVGIVYGMRVLGVGSLRNFANATVPDYDITKTGVNKTLEHKRALDALKASDIKTQVPPEDVRINPFKMADSLMQGVATDDGDDASRRSAERLKRDLESRKNRISSELTKIKVNSILGGSKPVARIDGEFVRVGDQVAELFTVKAIHGRSVELECDGKTYTLTMDEDLNQNKKGRNR